MYRPASPLPEETNLEEETNLKEVVSQLIGPKTTQTFIPDFFPIVRRGLVSYLHWDCPLPEETNLEEETNLKKVVSKLNGPKITQTLITYFFSIAPRGVVSYIHWDFFHAAVPGVVKIFSLPK